MSERHGWFRARLDAHLAGLLGSAEAEAFEAHRAACADCAAVLVEYACVDEASHVADGHLPESVIAAWPRASVALRGFERTLVRAHLTRCASCREDLEALGYDPLGSLDDVGAIVRPIKRSPARRWIAWSGWAAAAVLALLLVPQLRERGRPGTHDAPPATAWPPTHDAPQANAAPPASTGQPVVAPGIAAGFASPRIHLRAPARGESAPPLRVAIGADTRFLQLVVPPLDVPDATSITLVLIREADGVTSELRVRNDALFGDRAVVFGAAAQPIAPGRYRVSVRGLPGPEALVRAPEVAEYRLELVSRRR